VPKLLESFHNRIVGLGRLSKFARLSNDMKADELFRNVPANIHELYLALAGLPKAMEVKADLETGVSEKTVDELLARTTWPGFGENDATRAPPACAGTCSRVPVTRPSWRRPPGRCWAEQALSRRLVRQTHQRKLRHFHHIAVVEVSPPALLQHGVDPLQIGLRFCY